jgi:hypothetical protein
MKVKYMKHIGIQNNHFFKFFVEQMDIYFIETNITQDQRQRPGKGPTTIEIPIIASYNHIN